MNNPAPSPLASMAISTLSQLLLFSATCLPLCDIGVQSPQTFINQSCESRDDVSHLEDTDRHAYGLDSIPANSPKSSVYQDHVHWCSFILHVQAEGIPRPWREEHYALQGLLTWRIASYALTCEIDCSSNYSTVTHYRRYYSTFYSDTVKSSLKI
jgi:hypothetical protein